MLSRPPSALHRTAACAQHAVLYVQLQRLPAICDTRRRRVAGHPHPLRLSSTAARTAVTSAAAAAAAAPVTTSSVVAAPQHLTGTFTPSAPAPGAVNPLVAVLLGAALVVAGAAAYVFNVYIKPLLKAAESAMAAVESAAKDMQAAAQQMQRASQDMPQTMAAMEASAKEVHEVAVAANAAIQLLSPSSWVPRNIDWAGGSSSGTTTSSSSVDVEDAERDPQQQQSAAAGPRSNGAAPSSMQQLWDAGLPSLLGGDSGGLSSSQLAAALSPLLNLAAAAAAAAPGEGPTPFNTPSTHNATPGSSSSSGDSDGEPSTSAGVTRVTPSSIRSSSGNGAVAATASSSSSSSTLTSARQLLDRLDALKLRRSSRQTLQRLQLDLAALYNLVSLLLGPRGKQLWEAALGRLPAAQQGEVLGGGVVGEGQLRGGGEPAAAASSGSDPADMMDGAMAGISSASSSSGSSSSSHGLSVAGSSSGRAQGARVGPAPGLFEEEEEEGAAGQLPSKLHRSSGSSQHTWGYESVHAAGAAGVNHTPKSEQQRIAASLLDFSDEDPLDVQLVTGVTSSYSTSTGSSSSIEGSQPVRRRFPGTGSSSSSGGGVSSDEEGDLSRYTEAAFSDDLDPVEGHGPAQPRSWADLMLEPAAHISAPPTPSPLPQQQPSVVEGGDGYAAAGEVQSPGAAARRS